MMRVAVSGWLLPDPSGANRRLVALLRAVAAHLHADERVTLLHRPNAMLDDLPSRIERMPIAIPSGPTWKRVASERMRLASALRAIDATVCDHGFLPAPSAHCALALTIHDLRDFDGFSTRPRWLSKWALRRAIARAGVVIAPSEFTASRIRAVATPSRLLVIPNGVDLPQRDAVHAATPVRGRVLHVGHLEPRKNLEVLVRAFARLPANEPYELLLAGRDAGSGARLSQLAHSLGIAERVRILGAVDDAELARLYASAETVAVPSLYEGFGLAALEGLAWGRPTLIAKAGALPEIASGCAETLPPQDDEAWARAILRRDDSSAARDQRRMRAAEFSWERAGEALLAAWRSLSSGNARA